MLLKCEICGSADFVKDNGVFVCQNCGMKYTLAEVKNMISAACIDNNGETPQEKEPETLETEVKDSSDDNQDSDLEAMQNTIEEGNSSSNKKCPFCGAELLDDADEFCMMCGSKIVFNVETGTLPDILDRNESVCPKCGNPKYDESDDFCIYCGYAFGMSEDNDIADNSIIDKEPLEVIPLTDSSDSTTSLCTECGMPLYDVNDTFCIYCGARITEGESNSPSEPLIVIPTVCGNGNGGAEGDDEYNQTDTIVEMPVKEVMIAATTEGVKFDEDSTGNNSIQEKGIPQVDNRIAINDTEERLVEETPLPPQEEISNSSLEDLTHTKGTDSISNETLEKSIEYTDSKKDTDESRLKEEIEVTTAPNAIVSDEIDDGSLQVTDITEVKAIQIDGMEHCEQPDPHDSESIANEVTVDGGLENDPETLNRSLIINTEEAVPSVNDFAPSVDEGEQNPAHHVSISKSCCESTEPIEAEISINKMDTSKTDVGPGKDNQTVPRNRKRWIIISVAALLVIAIVVVVSLIPKEKNLAANESSETEVISTAITQEPSSQMVEQSKQTEENDTEQKQPSPIKPSESTVESSFENLIETSESAEVTSIDKEPETIIESIGEIELITEESFDTKEETQQETKAKEGIKTVVEETEKAFETEESRQNETIEPETTAAVQNGWAKVGEAYCYFVNGENKSGIGIIRPGWCAIGASPVFYIDQSLKPYQNQWLELDGNTYYFGNDCARVDNRWISINGVEYYFGDKGKLLRNGSAPDGRQTDENGALKQ